jgi:hypothetical protein
MSMWSDPTGGLGFVWGSTINRKGEPQMSKMMFVWRQGKTVAHRTFPDGRVAEVSTCYASKADRGPADGSQRECKRCDGLWHAKWTVILDGPPEPARPLIEAEIGSERDRSALVLAAFHARWPAAMASGFVEFEAEGWSREAQQTRR